MIVFVAGAGWVTIAAVVAVVDGDTRVGVGCVVGTAG
jgi:hypothetical protein